MGLERRFGSRKDARRWGKRPLACMKTHRGKGMRKRGGGGGGRSVPGKHFRSIKWQSPQPGF